MYERDTAWFRNLPFSTESLMVGTKLLEIF